MIFNQVVKGGGSGDIPIAYWNRPDYIPDITDYVIEEAGVIYICAEVTAEAKADSNALIITPKATAIKIYLFNSDGTVTETDVDMSQVHVHSGESRIYASTILPLGKLLLKVTTDAHVPYIFARQSSGSTPIFIYEEYYFGRTGTYTNVFKYGPNIGPSAPQKPTIMRIYCKNISFRGSFYVVSGLGATGLNTYTILTAVIFDNCDFSGITDAQYAFQQLYFTRLSFIGTKLNISNACTNISYAFGEYGDQSLDLSQCDFTGATNVTGMFRQYSHSNNWLRSLTMGKAPMISFDISPLTMLTHDSLISVINALQTVSSSQTLTMGSTNTAKLTAEEIAVATAKGWTVA